MINRYSYSEEIVMLTQQTWLRRQFKMVYVFMCIGILAGLLLLGLHMTLFGNILAIILMLFCVTNIFLYRFREKKYSRLEFERLKQMYPSKMPELTIELKDNIIVEMNGKQKTIPYSDIRYITNKKNLIFIYTQDKSALVLEKNSFLAGSWEEAYHYLRDQMKK